MLQSESLPDGPLDIVALIQSEWFDRTALIAEEGTLTYRELRQAVFAQATHFREAMESGQIATLEMPKSAEYVINLLAALAAGAVIAPIEPLWPDLRRQKLLDELKPRVRIQATGFIPGSTISTRLQGNREGDIPAYVFFTSGSNGTPKAILGSTRSLRRFIQWQGSEFNVGPKDRISFLTNIGFDVSLRSIGRPLMGARRQLWNG
jgi:D-alanine--poly(phosphoribitol) ligase subunit 1